MCGCCSMPFAPETLEVIEEREQDPRKKERVKEPELQEEEAAVGPAASKAKESAQGGAVT